MDWPIIGNVLLPPPGFDKYSCGEEPQKVQIKMISGRMVEESKKPVWRVSYVSDYIDDTKRKMALAVLRGGPFIGTFLPDNGNETITDTFLATSITPPTLLALDGTEPIWHGLAFELRSERPH